MISVALGASGCSSGTAGHSPTWVPQPDFQAGGEPQPQLPGNAVPGPQPSAPGGSASPNRPTPSQPGASGSPSQSTAADPAVVATSLDQPTGLLVLPDGTALVGERTTGRILQVQPQAGKPVVLVQTLAGTDPAGDGGLLDLALSPTYSQDGLIYAYLTTATDNRVVHFAIGSPPTTVIGGIPRGRTDNAGRIAFDATGALLVGTGDAGQPALAASPTSLAGKILRVDDVGQPLPDNPTPSSPIYATGFRTVDGLCVDAQNGARYAVSAGSPDEINLVKPAGNYGWPTPTAGSVKPIGTLAVTASGGGGCAAVTGRLAVATSTGQALAGGTVGQDGRIAAFTTTLVRKYGRLRTVVAAVDGALWLTTTNRDGHGKPIATDDRVIRISAADSGASSTL
jgi:glucose/arabinose dehydrogenase